MTYAERIRRLTEDPGANELAKICDQMQAQITACCGGGGLNNVAPPRSPETEEASKTADSKPK